MNEAFCGRCSQKLSGEVACDPRGNIGGHTPEYMHPACAKIIAAEMQAERELRRIRLERAAPGLLAACEAAEPEVNAAAIAATYAAGYGGKSAEVTRIERVLTALHAAIAAAKGGA